MPVFAKPVLSTSRRVPAKLLHADRLSKAEEDNDSDDDPENTCPNAASRPCKNGHKPFKGKPAKVRTQHAAYFSLSAFLACSLFRDSFQAS